MSKLVNNDPAHADLGTTYEVFTYTLKTQISKNAESFVITDTLVDELEFAGNKGDVKVTIGGKDVTGELKSLTVDGQTLTAELAYDHLVKLEGQDVEVTFIAKIREGADLSKYNNADGKPEVPNEASVILNNDAGDHTIKSNVVTVTPPDRDRTTLGVKVSKRILGGSDELPGAKLVVYYLNEDGTYTEVAIPEWTSGEEANLIDLYDGEYVLVETYAPEGYEIAGPITFRVTGNGTVLEVLKDGKWVAPAELNTIIMYDEKKSEDTPPTPPGEKEENPPVTTPPTTTPPTTTPTPGTPGTPSTTRRVVTPSSPTVSRATSTGDSNTTALWIVLAAAAAAALAAAAVVVTRRRRED